jgi:outer membrane lipoprotein-sorting protein
MSDCHNEEMIRRLERLGEVVPTPEATRHALHRVREVLARGPRSSISFRGRILLRRYAAAAVVLLAIGGLFAWLLPSPSPVRAAFAEVQAAMMAARSVTCRQITRTKGNPDETIRFLILDNGLWRAEESDGSYSVTDTNKYRTLLVNPQKRAATVLQGVNAPQVNLYEHIKNLPNDASARAMQGKKIGGKDALGFVVKVQGHDLTVWADAKTRLPVRLEAEEKDEKGKSHELAIDEFVFDKQLDTKLFSLEAPAGYRIETKGVAEFPATPTDPQLKDLVVTPLVGIGPVKFGMERADVEKLLGKSDAVEERGSNGYVNMSYGSRGFFIGVSKPLGVVTISCVAQKAMAFRVRDFSGKTDKGIALGASTADIIRTYGEPDSKEKKEGSTYLSYHKLQADFTLFSDKLVQMHFNRQRPAK